MAINNPFEFSDWRNSWNEKVLRSLDKDREHKWSEKVLLWKAIRRFMLATSLWIGAWLYACDVRAEEGTSPCWDWELYAATCEDWVYYPQGWDFDIPRLAEEIIDLSGESIDIEWFFDDVEYARNIGFQTRAAVWFERIKFITGYSISWEDLIPFMRLDQYIQDWEYYYAEQQINTIVQMYSWISDMWKALNSLNLLNET